MAQTFEHDDGRVCSRQSKFSSWQYTEDDGRRTFVCMKDHAKDHDEVDDRGEFGMPGIGISAAAIDASQLPHWRLGPGHVFTTLDNSDLWSITKDGVRVEHSSGVGKWTEPATDDAKYILSILPQIIEQFLEKNRKYASVEKGYDLGDKGIIPDLNRKLGILVDRIWDGNSEVGEPTDEVVGDMIGHLLLFLAKRRGHG